MTDFTLEILPLRQGLIAGRDNAIDALIKVSATAPEEADPNGAALDLSIVIDRSGSMAGSLEDVKRCVRAIIDRAGSNDRIGVIAYDTLVESVVPFGPLTNWSDAREAIDGLTARGGTDLHLGWRTGVDELRHGLGDAVPGGQSVDRLTRVLLLSDGLANAGIADPVLLSSLCREQARAGISTSTFGVGHDFGEDLMTAMAKFGSGNAYYGKTSAELIGCYEQELDALRAMRATNLALRFTPADGVRVDERNGHLREGAQLLLPDLAAGSSAISVVRLHVPAAIAVEGSAPAVLSCQVTLHALGRGAVSVEATLRLPVMTAAAFEALDQNEEVHARLCEARAAELMDMAASAAQRGDWRGVEETLAIAHAEAGSNQWVRDALTTLLRYAHQQDQMSLQKEAHYQSKEMRRKLRGFGEAEAFDRDAEASRMSFLRRKREQGLNE